MNIKSKFISYWVLGVGMLFLSAAASSYDNQEKQIPDGTYSVAISDDDLPSVVPPDMRRDIKGKYEILVANGKENRYTVKRKGETFGDGVFTLKPDYLEIRDVWGRRMCSRNTFGRYKWKFE